MKKSDQYAAQAAAIIKELDRRYHITRDALFTDLLQAGINYAAARWLEGMDSGHPDTTE